MRSKQILSIIAFITTFVLSSAFAFLFIDRSVPTVSFSNFETRNTGCRQDAETKLAVESFLRQDISNGRERLWRINGSDDSSAKSYLEKYADSVEQYADESGSMNFRHLPYDFQIRWKAHMRAWRDYSDFLNNAKDSVDSEDESFYRDQNEYLIDINSTWYSVLRVGRNYCAQVSE